MEYHYANLRQTPKDTIVNQFDQIYNNTTSKFNQMKHVQLHKSKQSLNQFTFTHPNRDGRSLTLSPKLGNGEPKMAAEQPLDLPVISADNNKKLTTNLRVGFQTSRHHTNNIWGKPERVGN